MASSHYDINGARIRAFLAILAFVALGFGGALIYVRGSVVIFDPDGVVKEVALRDSSRKVFATPVAGRLYVASARLEGEVQVRCMNDRGVSYGYYTTATQIWQKIKASNCDIARPASTATASASYRPTE